MGKCPNRMLHRLNSGFFQKPLERFRVFFDLDVFLLALTLFVIIIARTSFSGSGLVGLYCNVYHSRQSTCCLHVHRSSFEVLS